MRPRPATRCPAPFARAALFAAALLAMGLGWRAATPPTADAAPPEKPKRKLADLAPKDRKTVEQRRDLRLAVDAQKLAARGVRRIAGRHLVLYTDVPEGVEIDALPRLFDLAVPQWCAYFQLDPAALAQWKIQGYLIRDKALFQSLELLPPDLPPFLNGYATQQELWLYDQKADYYRRHLLLHEGTHALMFSQFGEAGPPWYIEGMAELLGAHRLEGDKLTLGWFPDKAESVEDWGRIKLIKQACKQEQGLSLRGVVALGPQAHLQNMAYGWSWAAAALLDGHPRYRERFRQLPGVLKKSSYVNEFNDEFAKLFAEDWRELEQEWGLFSNSLEYGYDAPRMAIDFKPGAPLTKGGQTVSIAADRGWQSSGLQLAEGQAYDLTAAGRFEIARTTAPWPCEADGVTLRYYQGLPLGRLLAALRNGDGQFVELKSVGAQATLKPEQSGVLYLRLNDSGAELAENRGECRVTVRPAP